MGSFLSDTWFFSGEVKEGFSRRIPEEARPFALRPDGLRDLDEIAGAGSTEGTEGVVYNTFELPAPRRLGFGFCCDWWEEVWLNGEMVYTTFPAGNNTSFFAPDNHTFICDGRAGKNLLAVRVRRGGASWVFGAASIPFERIDPCLPLTVTVDPEKRLGPVKPMNAVNNGPIGAKATQIRSNVEPWKKAGIPFCRTHDSSFCSAYGGEHTVDVHAVFPDFSRDPDDPASYDFTLTDSFLKRTMEAGTQIFYRLGSKIEHWPKKYGTRPPADFRKWAVICEHIIRHYNEGWAEGFHMNILYWEIWNEPDCRDDATWQGGLELFCTFFRTAALHLKKCFPGLKIGGPALGFDLTWARHFLERLTAGERVPLDFFSWHIYTVEPVSIACKGEAVRRLLDEFGYIGTESILDEWNYVRGWTTDFVYSIETIIGMKGAAFTAACMAVGQSAPVDMLMYYDARPSVFNGLFDFYTLRPLKGYYPFLAWSELAALGHQIAADTQGRPGVYAAAASDGKGKVGVLVSRFFESDRLPGPLELMLKIKGLPSAGLKARLLDASHDFTEIPLPIDREGALKLNLEANTVLYIGD